MEIIVDDREKAIFSFLEEASSHYKIDYKIQRSEIGDYAICYRGRILSIIERKTWVDLAASMRDGRKENVHKLIKLRADIGCQILYLIEGDATPSFDKKFGNLPIKNLRAHLDHLAYRDNIHIIYSKDLSYTSKRLFELAQNYSTIDGLCKDIDASIPVSTETATESVVEGEGVVGSSEVDKLKEKQVSLVNIAEQVLRCIPGIGSIISSLLADNNITLSALYLDSMKEEPAMTNTIAAFKYTTGACVGLDKAQKIMTNTKKIFTSNALAYNKVRVRILATIPLISKATAIKLLEEFDLSDIVENVVKLSELAAFQKTEKVTLGKKAAGNIIKYLCPE